MLVVQPCEPMTSALVLKCFKRLGLLILLLMIITLLLIVMSLLRTAGVVKAMVLFSYMEILEALWF